MNKAKIIAISALCSAVALGCLLLAALPGMKWAMLLLGVVASIATAIPLLLDDRNLVYALLTYFVAGVLGVFLGLANVAFVVPIVAFCMPFAIVKVYGETVKVTVQKQDEQVLPDPFDGGDDRKVVAIKVDGRTRLPKVVKWVLYYVLLEIGIGLTVLAAYLFTRPVFDAMISAKWFWLAVVMAQLIVYPYNILLNGCFSVAVKILHRAIKP